MKIVISGYTDVGTTRQSNQDRVLVKAMESPLGNIGFTVVCDGMGGLSEGEKASQTLIKAFNTWAEERLPMIWSSPITLDVIKSEWSQVVDSADRCIKAYGESKGIKLGTTAVAVFVTDASFFVMNIGDSRAYEITDYASQLTKDQTLVAREVELGNLTPEQAETDPRRNIILQCVGASKSIVPEFAECETSGKTTFMLCSDGLYHFLNESLINDSLSPYKVYTAEELHARAVALVEYVKEQGETDNITIALMRVEKEEADACFGRQVFDELQITEEM